MNTANSSTVQRILGQMLSLAEERMPELEDPALLAAVRLAMGEAIKRAGRVLVFKHLGTEGSQEVFELGYEGEPLRTLRTGERCVWWLWAALDDAGKTSTLRAIAFAAPDAAHPDASARKALRKTAVAIVEHYVPELKALAASVEVRDGIIRFAPSYRAPRIVTR